MMAGHALWLHIITPTDRGEEKRSEAQVRGKEE
jgi:hypothetical protein